MALTFRDKNVRDNHIFIIIIIVIPRINVPKIDYFNQSII